MMTHPYGSDPAGDQPNQGAGAASGRSADSDVFAQWSAQTSGPDYGAASGTPTEATYGDTATPGAWASSAATTPAPARPPTVLIASVLAWVGAAVFVFFGAMFLASRDVIVDELAGQVPPGIGDVVTGVGGFLLVWGLAIAALAVFAFRGAMWAVWVLTVLGGLFMLLCLLILTGGATESLILIAWVGASIALYLVPKSREWYRAKRRLGPAGDDFNPGVYTR